MKKIPMRTCVITREKMPKVDLIRVVKTDNGIIVDNTGKVNGHGVYIKRNEEVILQAKSKKILNKVLETNVDDSIYDELLEKIK